MARSRGRGRGGAAGSGLTRGGSRPPAMGEEPPSRGGGGATGGRASGSRLVIHGSTMAAPSGWGRATMASVGVGTLSSCRQDGERSRGRWPPPIATRRGASPVGHGEERWRLRGRRKTGPGARG